MDNIGRESLPHHWGHDIPSSGMREIYMITICCRDRGRNQLAIPSVWQGISETLIWRQNANHIKCDLALAMPDHLHAMISFVQKDMQTELRAIKAWLAKAFEIKWQRDFFDHRVRSWESCEEKAEYIKMNPVRANLVNRAEDWPFQM